MHIRTHWKILRIKIHSCNFCSPISSSLNALQFYGIMNYLSFSIGCENGSSYPVNQMIPWIRTNNPRHLTHLQAKTRILKWLLHLPPLKKSQVATISLRRAIRSFRGVLGKRLMNPLRLNASFVGLEFGESVLRGEGNLLVGPAGDGVAGSGVFDEEVGGADLFLRHDWLFVCGV